MISNDGRLDENHVEDTLQEEGEKLGGEMLAEYPSCKLALPYCVLELNEETRALDKLVLIVKCCELDNFTVILEVTEISSVEVFIFQRAIE